MQAVTTIGLDIAKSVFQVHGVDAQGTIAIRRPLKRRQVLPFFKKLPPCLVGIEACATSHHWSRQLQALGHTVRLMPPAYVRPYVKSQKNDAADAEAICEAVMRPSMRFVETKTPEQQQAASHGFTEPVSTPIRLHLRQQTAVINAIRDPTLARSSASSRRSLGRSGVEELHRCHRWITKPIIGVPRARSRVSCEPSGSACEPTTMALLHRRDRAHPGRST